MLLIDDNYFFAAKYAIEQARKYIFLSLFLVDPLRAQAKGRVADLVNALIAKKREGLDVRALLDVVRPYKGKYSKNVQIAHVLLRGGIDVRHLKRGRSAHAKFMCIDDEAAIIGSHNWTRNSLTRNFELSYVILERGEIAQVKDLFLGVFADVQKVERSHLDKTRGEG